MSDDKLIKLVSNLEDQNPPFEIHKEIRALIETNLHEDTITWLKKSDLSYSHYLVGLIYCINNNRKDYVESMKWFRKSAEQNNPYGVNGLGCMYDDRDSVQKDIRKSAKLFHHSAKQGNVYAQCNFGLHCEKTKDFIKAEKWYRKSAEQGYSMAQYVLGRLYKYGKGVKVDMKEALKWYSESAEQGDKHTQYRLGCIYKSGVDIQKDLKETVRLFTLSAEQGYMHAQYELGMMYWDGDGVDKDLRKTIRLLIKSVEQKHKKASYTLGQIYVKEQSEWAKEHSDIKEYIEEAVNKYCKDVKSVQKRMGMIFRHAKGVSRDLDLAIRWYSKCADDAEVQCFLGEIFREKGDYKEAIKWYQKSTDQEHVSALGDLAAMYYNGLGVDQDFDKASKLFSKGVELGEERSMFALGMMYYEGTGVDHDYKKAIELFHRSSNNIESAQVLGEMYEMGTGVEIDYMKALYWYNESKMLGNSDIFELQDNLLRTRINPTDRYVDLQSEVLRLNTKKVIRKTVDLSDDILDIIVASLSAPKKGTFYLVEEYAVCYDIYSKLKIEETMRDIHIPEDITNIVVSYRANLI